MRKLGVLGVAWASEPMHRSASNSASDFPEYAREVKEHSGGGHLAAGRLRGRAYGPDGKTFISNFSDGYGSLIFLLKIIHRCG